MKGSNSNSSGGAAACSGSGMHVNRNPTEKLRGNHIELLEKMESLTDENERMKKTILELQQVSRQGGAGAVAGLSGSTANDDGIDDGISGDRVGDNILSFEVELKLKVSEFQKEVKHLKASLGSRDSEIRQLNEKLRMVQRQSSESTKASKPFPVKVDASMLTDESGLSLNIDESNVAVISILEAKVRKLETEENAMLRSLSEGHQNEINALKAIQLTVVENLEFESKSIINSFKESNQLLGSTLEAKVKELQDLKHHLEAYKKDMESRVRQIGDGNKDAKDYKASFEDCASALKVKSKSLADLETQFIALKVQYDEKCIECAALADLSKRIQQQLQQQQQQPPQHQEMPDNSDFNFAEFVRLKTENRHLKTQLAGGLGGGGGGCKLPTPGPGPVSINSGTARYKSPNLPSINGSSTSGSTSGSGRGNDSSNSSHHNGNRQIKNGI